jgi:release factor glutamine methyltransferase
MNQLTIRNLYDTVCKNLQDFGIKDFYSEADYIMSKMLNIRKFDYYLYPEKKVGYKDVTKIVDILNKRFLRQPLSYIFNETEFYGFKFKLNSDVLIPRQETEFVVEKVIDEINKNKYQICADIGTGCGNIAISVTKVTKIKKMYATDIEPKILSLAKDNAKNLKVSNRIKFVLSDVLSYFVKNKIKLDLIISNPPYVSQNEYLNLQPEIYFEPIRSLVSPTGLEIYKKIANEAGLVLNTHGKIILEINPNLENEIKKIFLDKKFFNIKVFKDYNNLARIMEIWK